MKLSKVMLFGAVAIFGLTGCSLDHSVIVKVNDVGITKAQYDEIYKRELSESKQTGRDIYLKDPQNIMSLATKDKIVNELIIKEIIKQEIEKRNIEVSPEEVQTRKAEITEKLGSKERVEELLRRHNVSNKQFEKDIESEIKMDKLVESVGEIKVSDKEIKDFYNQNLSSFDYPERVRASHILIEANPALIQQQIISQDKKGELSADEIAKKTQETMDTKMNFAKEVREKAAKDPSSFAALAKEFSDDKISAQKGGDLGFFPREAMVKPFSDAAFKLKPGTVSEVVVTDYGNHIIIVTDRAKAGLQPFEKVKDEIGAYLLQKKRVDTMTTLLDGLRASSKVEYIDSSFDTNKIQEQIKQKAKEQEEAIKALDEKIKSEQENSKDAPLPPKDGKNPPSPKENPAK